MPLKIIYGRAGTGKTTACIEEIRQTLLKTPCNIIYLTPEQYSLDAERMFSSALAGAERARVEVLSFERLAHRVFAEVGPVICSVLDDTGKRMLAERCILKVSGKLTYFTGVCGQMGFVTRITDLIKELKQNGMTAEHLQAAAERTESRTLKYKLYDCMLILKEYEAQLQAPLTDSDDHMRLLREKIERFGLFGNTCVYADHFTGFTREQREVLRVLLRQCVSLTVTLTTDSLAYRDPFELFYRAKKTAQQLFEMAQDERAEVLPNTYLQKCLQFSDNEELAHLERAFFQLSPGKYLKKTENLKIFRSKDYNAEIEQIAAEIRRLVRCAGYRYRDIAVVIRDSELYNPIIKDVFSRFEILFNTSENISPKSLFLLKGLTSIFEIVVQQYTFDAVFSFVKSDFCKLPPSAKYLLENYVFEAGNAPWFWNSNRPLTFQGSFSDLEFQQIQDAVAVVRQTIAAFTSRFSGRKTAGEIIAAYQSFLGAIDAENVTVRLAKRFKAEGNLQLYDETAAVYNRLIDVLNMMQSYFGDLHLTFEKFYAILNAGLSNQGIGQIPAGVDDVQVLLADRIFAQKFKVVFVAGVTDGVLPRGYVNEGIFSDLERAELDLESDSTMVHCDENGVIYNLLVSASDKLYLCYPQADNEGAALKPSSVISTVKRLFPNISECAHVAENMQDLSAVEAVLPAFHKAVEYGGKGVWGTVAAWMQNNRPELYHVIERSAAYSNLSRVLQPDVVAALYGGQISSSVSRIEQYNRCQFAYFVRYGLNVLPRREFKMDAADTGSYMHEIIDRYSKYAQAYGWDRMTEAHCHEKAEALTHAVLEQYLSTYYTESKRFSYLFGKITGIMKATLWSITQFYKQSGYVALGYELEFDENGGFAPITVTLDDGREVVLRGKIDRADVRRTEQGDFVSIVDYKSSQKDIDYTKVLCGVQIQLPAYISAVCGHLAGTGGRPIPAAMLYYKIDMPLVNGTRDTTDEELVQALLKSMKMRGVMLENCMIDDLFVVKSNVTTRQLDRLCKTAYRQLKKAVASMLDGQIAINPLRLADGTACDYCPYGSVCGFHTDFRDNKYRSMKKINKEAFFEYVGAVDGESTAGN